ncbi:hypothetical protein AC629_08250 [Bradyrhizobium sp. NAS80.1]|nr:hypothetical protein AC630_31140 [Bradyrhizobium sp. AS23.2]OKO88846.1 hypothetical protein AC629_08250 [Bradyrhizobium sp. NAS80.1]
MDGRTSNHGTSIVHAPDAPLNFREAATFESMKSQLPPRPIHPSPPPPTRETAPDWASHVLVEVADYSDLLLQVTVGLHHLALPQVIPA